MRIYCSDQSFTYQLLDRLRSDCDYVLNIYDRPETPGDISREERTLAEKFLWAGNVKDQIKKMRELYDSLVIKPEWLSLEDIDEYESRFNAAQVGKKRPAINGTRRVYPGQNRYR